MIIAATAMVALTTVFASPASAATYFQLRTFNGYTGTPWLCMSVGGASLVDGAPVVQWACRNTGGRPPEATWFWSGEHIVNAHSGKCLAIGGGSIDHGARAIQWTCGGGEEQDWTRVSLGTGNGWELRNQKSNLLLSVAENSHDQGAWIIQWPRNGTDGQAWEQRYL